MSDITRRGFLKGMAAGAMGLGVASLAGSRNAFAAEGEKAPETVPQAEGAPVINPQRDDFRTCSITDFSKSALFSDWKLGKFTFNHRMVKTSALQLAFLRRNPDEYINYYKRMADGGVQMIWIEDFMDIWASSGGPSFMKQSIDAYDVKGLVDTLHAAGATLGYQFGTMGTALGPMAYTRPFIGDYDTDTVKKWIEDTVNMGVILKENGFDAFELNMAGNNLGQSFLSAGRNNRTDEYGNQSIENRCRFAAEIIQGVKEKCGEDFVVQMLINGVEENDAKIGNNAGNNSIYETIAIAKELEKAGADSLHLRIAPTNEHICQFAGDLYFAAHGFEGYTGAGGRFDFDRHFDGLVRGNNYGVGLALDMAAAVKAAVSIPVGCATYNDPAQAPDLFNSYIEEGKIDFLMMNRPFCVDPEYVNKLREGRLDEIAPCTRCLHCFYDSPLDRSNMEHCRVNAANFRAYSQVMPEGFEPLPAETPKKVMVIGGGPAGMEAARIAAQRGHSVKLYERSGSLGGLLIFAEMVKGPHENLGTLRSYLARQQELKGVEVLLGENVTRDQIEKEAADVVILATGGKRPTLGLESTAGTNVLPIEGAMGRSVGEKVVVLGGNAQAMDIALYLMNKGKKVTIVSPSPASDFEKGHSAQMKNYLQGAFFGAGGRFFAGAQINGVGDGCLQFTSDTGVEYEYPCDTVIEALDMLPDTSLIDGLDNAFAVGDCALPFNIANAIATGNVTARAI
ncbi:MAG: FAD-dependent oxidoreductase [Lachnospiraceae bacterium]|nr:FAD-dependent oxidoreductase [Lachnospiraceae bacterium]